MIKQKLLFFSAIVGLMFFYLSALASKFPLPPKGDDLFGKIQFATVNPGDTFVTIGMKYDVGFYELVAANPEVDPDNLSPNTILIIPTRYILPHVEHTGIIINLATMRLFYFPENKNYFYTYPIGIGKYDWGTPLGLLRIIQKIQNPVWVVPDSIMKYRQEHGDPVPKVVLPGPDNPLGEFAMRLSKPTYLIHGTNDPGSVGRRSSAGCIHLYPEDIKRLFDMIPMGTRVLVINQPYQVGTQGGKLYIEAHLPLKEQRDTSENTSAIVTALISSALGSDDNLKINWQKAGEVVKEHTGIPTRVGELPLQSESTTGRFVASSTQHD